MGVAGNERSHSHRPAVRGMVYHASSAMVSRVQITCTSPRNQESLPGSKCSIVRSCTCVVPTLPLFLSYLRDRVYRVTRRSVRGVPSAVAMSLVGVGVHQMWGLSPAIDCLEQLRVIHGSNSAGDGASKSDETNADSTDEPINVLLLQPGDVRHVLKTIAQRRAHKYGSRPIHVRVSPPHTSAC